MLKRRDVGTFDNLLLKLQQDKPFPSIGRVRRIAQP